MARQGLSFPERRLALGLTQPELARRLGVSRPTIARLEAAADVPLLYDLALRGLESLELTAPDYQRHQDRPRRRLG